MKICSAIVPIKGQSETKKMLTETELMAKALAKPLSGEPSGFGASEAKLAIDVATTLFRANKCDAGTFGRVVVRLGNHSALRQWGIAHGFIVSPADALSNAVSEEIAKMKEEIDEAIS